MSSAAEDAESVDQFLARIASLKDRHDREDEERIRKVEEDILQGRKRQTGAQGRAVASRSIDPPVEFIPPSQTQTPTRAPKMVPSQSPRFSKDLSDPAVSNAMPTPPTATSLARSGTLSWQQRPSSRDSNSSRPRPFLGLPAPSVPADLSTIEPEEELSRSQIAKSLGSKDPAFFRQTADRGIGSAAFRRNESEEDFGHSPGQSMRLPGMSREQSVEPEQFPNLDGASAKPQLSVQNSRTTNTRPLDGPSSTVQSSAAISARSSPLSTPKLAPVGPAASDGNHADSSSAAFPGWGSSRRPPSPTKGLGGFVESAMMKRSDSISKRWSVQAAPGLKRGDSVASNRSTLGGAGTATGSLNAGSPPRQTRPIRPLSSSSPAGSRPTSSHGISKLGLSSQKFPLELSSEVYKEAADTAMKKAKLPDGKDTSSDFQNVTQKASGEHGPEHTLPVSPSKTMDSRRWSPTKSSWLESALARPESPKTLPSKPEEPAWKSSMHKAKASIGSPFPANFEVNTTGLLRSPPMGGHVMPHRISGMPEGFSSGIVKKSPEKSTTTMLTGFAKSTAVESKYGHDPRHSDSLHAATRPETEFSEPPRASPPPRSEPYVTSPIPTAQRALPLVKAKPAMPPKTDFRSALRPRQVASSQDSNAEPEFKAAFGKLKRTQTKNYVATDELKNTITKGKAGLSLTGGPQKTERVDEFKESILQKKEAMKEGTGLVAKPSVRERPAPIVPEALARKEAMKTAPGLSGKTTINESSAPVVPEALAKRKLLGKSAGSAPESKEAPLKPETQSAAPIGIVGPVDLLRRSAKPETLYEGGKTLPTTEYSSVAQLQPRIEPPKQDLANSKLASRLNPALAGFLSRGASPKSSNNPSTSASTDDLSLMPRELSRKVTNESEETGGATLTHMTKARAKGPKRRVPKAEASVQAATPAAPVLERGLSQPQKLTEAKIFGKNLPKHEEAPLVEAAPASQSTPAPIKAGSAFTSKPRSLASVLKARDPPEQQQAEATMVIAESKNSSKDKPVVMAESPDLSKVSPPTPKAILIEEKPEVVAKSSELLKLSSPSPKPVVTEAPASPVKDRMRAFDVAQDYSKVPADKSVTSTGGWSKASTISPVPSPLTPSTTRLNTPSSASTSSAAQQKPSGISSTKPVSGLGLDLAASSRKKVVPTATELTPPPEKPQPLSVKKSLPTDGAADRETPAASKLRGGSNTTAQFRDFFDQTPKTREKADFDTQAIMSPNKNLGQKIKTLNMKIWQITGNGKKETMPGQQEHILFEDSMYLCVHAFQSESNSKRTEAHLWVGEAVSEAAVEDAQLFCRKIARDNSAKLDVLQQGKETASFFQALGGIVITRRNKHSALYMLCGRRHLGHVAFDEVDLAASSLCSGFPYIISAKFGKLFLWKGRGSSADELGCARLIGMDLGLTGEIEEINEGEEPNAFWESFASRKRSQSSDLWDLKSSHDAYTCRLYRVEMDRPKSATGFWGRRGSSPLKTSNRALVEEISPFCQGDISPQHIYLLDAYFEIYVYVGDQAPSKHTEFVTALMLAQEMSMLAPTLQDRPLMPACHLVFGDPPGDFKAVVRKWEDERYEMSLVVPLDEAIEALQ